MRNTLSLKWMLALVCIVFGVSCVDAAERIIRPRRVNRSAGRTIAVAPTSVSIAEPVVSPASPVMSPVMEDGTNQAPLKALTPPDKALLKSGLTRPANLMREFGEEYADDAVEDYQETRTNPPEKAPEPEADGDEDGIALPPYVPYENYQEMNRQRQDFHPPMESEAVEEAREEAIAPEPVADPDPESMEISPAPPLLYADGTDGLDGTDYSLTMAVSAPPTPAEVESYRRRLEFRLLERYNNLPEYAGEVGKVTVVLSKPLQPSLDGTRLRAEFDQLVYDPWGKRIPALEKEYHVVTFSAGGVRQVRSDPSIRVGLNHEKTYSEPGPDSDIAEKLRTMPSDHAFRAAPGAEVPRVHMPDWWRPEFSDDGY